MQQTPKDNGFPISDLHEMWRASGVEMEFSTFLDMLDVWLTDASDTADHVNKVGNNGQFLDEDWYASRYNRELMAGPEFGPSWSPFPKKFVDFSKEGWTTYKKWIALKDKRFEDEPERRITAQQTFNHLKALQQRKLADHFTPYISEYKL